MKLEDYAALGGHVDHVRPVEDVLKDGALRQVRAASKGAA
jgi:hypothetical protein